MHGALSNGTSHDMHNVIFPGHISLMEYLAIPNCKIVSSNVSVIYIYGSSTVLLMECTTMYTGEILGYIHRQTISEFIAS